MGFGGVSFAKADLQPREKVLPLDLEASGEEVYAYAKNHNLLFLNTDNFSDQIELAIHLGTRNLEWLHVLNAHRPQDQSLRFSDPKHRVGFPITAPKKYGPASIEKDYKDLATNLPIEILTVCQSSSDYPISKTLSDEDYLLWARKVNTLYQTAVRWKSMQPWIAELTDRKREDVRGYYFLREDKDLEKKLTNFYHLDVAEQLKISVGLIGLCINSEGIDGGCEQHVNQAGTANKLLEFYQRYEPPSQTLYENFFHIAMKRPDVQWSVQNPELMSVPFRTHDEIRIQKFLSVNIEDEWKWNEWHLRLNFQPDANAHVEFQAGALPHVDGIAGNTITMDGNVSLDEPEVQWIIRHEFGHVLGFPDCYVEYYEPKENLMISYQLDTTNLMCSRAGNMVERMYQELKSAYLH